MRSKNFFLLIICIGCSKLFAQSLPAEISLQTDNDVYLFNGSDKYYTDGLVLNYRRVLKIPTTRILQNKIIGFEAGQKIFTPHTAVIHDSVFENYPSEIDRPFAAYLYVGSSLYLLYKNESTLKLGAQIGIVGPGAFGKEVQTFVHKNFGFYTPVGWKYQIDNNVVLNLSAEYTGLVARNSWLDFSFYSQAKLGNGFSGCGVGGMVRIGKFNPFFNSISTQSNALQSNSIPSKTKPEFFFFYKPEVDFIAYDATVQGGLFTSKKNNSIAVTRNIEPVVLVNQFGIGYSKNNLGIYLAVIFNTKNVKEMFVAHQWGSITLSYGIK